MTLCIIKKSYPNSPIFKFSIRGARIGKTFSLEFIIHILLRLYNKNIYPYLIKIKVILVTSIGEATFNIDGLTIHLTLNIHVQQSLFNLPNQQTH
jgi:hypothetical protein